MALWGGGRRRGVRSLGSPAPPAGPPPAAAAAEPSLPAGGPSPVATRVAAWGQVHWGWVLVYSDAQVLLYTDSDAPVPDGASRFSVVDRHLTPAGLDRVRTGTVAPSSLFPHNPIPTDMWGGPRIHHLRALPLRRLPSHRSVVPRPDDGAGNASSTRARAATRHTTDVRLLQPCLSGMDAASGRVLHLAHQGGTKRGPGRRRLPRHPS